jgi:hypothetical protein
VIAAPPPGPAAWSPATAEHLLRLGDPALVAPAEHSTAGIIRYRRFRPGCTTAHPAGYEQLRRTLRVWSLATIAVNRDGYQEELAAVRDGTAATNPLSEAVLAL